MPRAGRTRYAQVGLGVRSWMYSLAVATRYAGAAELVGLCDSNPGRVAARVEWARSNRIEAPGYAAGDFDRMLRETRPDAVIVTTPDCFHDLYICRALEAGCNVVTEKPLATDAAKCQRILDAQRQSGRTCRVTFNYRYSPPRTQVKELLASGVIGEVRSVDFHWLLDTRHGADYFRRWHRRKEISGGLIVHKATHHFDLVNWWLDSVPERVFATGERRFYRPEQADRYGLGRRTGRCLDCPEAGRCPFHLDLRARRHLKALYLDCERHDGYHRDGCVFSPEIDIEDSIQAVVEYASGARMSYSLNAFMPWEGYAIAFNGSRGRLEHRMQESAYVSGDDAEPGALRAEGSYIRIHPHFAAPYEVELWKADGAHGGGDARLLEDVFGRDQAADPYGRAADHRAGAWSILTGVAANRSMASGEAVRIDSLVTGLDAPRAGG